MIPFLDVQRINERFEGKFKSAFAEFLDSGQCILGDKLRQFEQEFANYCGTEYCLGVGSGLDAITLIFKGYIQLGKLKKGDEVLVPSNTYIASILGIINAGLKPVLVEANLLTFNLSLTDIKGKISEKVKAVLVVHLYGQLEQMNEIHELAKVNDLIVIEDAAQAHGAVLENDKKAGNLANAAAFSFYPSKNLGALGDGGAVTTNDKQLFEVVKKLRNYGSSEKYVNTIEGVNSRLDELQAAFLSIKLKSLDSDNEHRRTIAKHYLNKIKNKKIILPYYNESDNHVFHVFVIRCNQREELQNYLLANNIQTVIHYPIPPHKQKALKRFNKYSFPYTEQLHNQVLSLPISPIQSIDTTERIINVLNQF